MRNSPYTSFEPGTDAGRVILMAPSHGLGGGIERYTETIEEAFISQNIKFQRHDLYRPWQRAKASAHARMYAASRNYLRGSTGQTQLALMHRSLLPVALVLAKRFRICGISVVCHGNDVWGRSQVRRNVEDRLMCRPEVRIIANSTFTAGALARVDPVTILPPGISGDWFRTLVEASGLAKPVCPGTKLVTAFSLARWREKGLLQLLEAVKSLGREDISVTVCGTGEPSGDLLQVLREYRNCSLRVGLSPAELAYQFAAADIFVLATQARTTPNAFYESFGLVLAEAQIAGTPVVAPALGGSRDAIVAQQTGLIPKNQSTEALAEVLDQLLKDPQRVADMGAMAANWAREVFAPDRYALRAIDALLQNRNYANLCGGRPTRSTGKPA